MNLMDKRATAKKVILTEGYMGELARPHHTSTNSLKKQDQQIQNRFFNYFVRSAI